MLKVISRNRIIFKSQMIFVLPLCKANFLPKKVYGFPSIAWSHEGLNCGGHAFATDGFLMGPIMEEFHTKRQELITELHKIYRSEALKPQNKTTFCQNLMKYE